MIQAAHRVLHAVPCTIWDEGETTTPTVVPKTDIPETETIEEVEEAVQETTGIEITPLPAPPGGSSGEGFRVILYDDDYHGMDEVTAQIHKATQYPPLKCVEIMLEAHQKGRAICYNGSREKCHRVTKVLREINLQCEVDCD